MFIPFAKLSMSWS